MSETFIDGLPELGDASAKLGLYPGGQRICIRGSSAFLHTPRFIARLNLQAGHLDWLVERSLAVPDKEVWRQPRYISIWGSQCWASEPINVITELSQTECGGLLVLGWDAGTGAKRWEHFISIPEAAEWAESVPAWPGAQTEEVYAFIADNPKHLTICLYRQSRRSGCVRPSSGIHILDFPPFNCQTDAVRLDLSNGKPIWNASFQGLYVGIMQRYEFKGVWSRGTLLGSLDFETGENSVLLESPNELGCPVIDGNQIAIPWHNSSEIGVEWLDRRGCSIRRGSTSEKKVKSTALHATSAGLALQTNDQGLSWLGHADRPRWKVRAKPYIYRVFCCPRSQVLIGTDGNGGRLLGFDPATGRETLNLKPALGGVGVSEKVPGHDVLVGLFRTSRSYSVPPHLLIFSMRDGCYDLETECQGLLGTWEHGALCLAGQNKERLAIIDVRSMGTPFL